MQCTIFTNCVSMLSIENFCIVPLCLVFADVSHLQVQAIALAYLLVFLNNPY